MEKLEKTERPDVRAFVIAGASLLGLAGVFFWRDLDLNHEYLLGVAAFIAAAAAVAGRPLARAHAGAVGLIACSAVGGVWFAATKSPPLLIGIGSSFVGALVALLCTDGEATAEPGRERHRFAWLAVTLGGLVASGAFYFSTLTVGFAQESVARRLVLTLAWLVTGIALVIAAWVRKPAAGHAVAAGGAIKRMAPMLVSGYAFAASAILKLVTYDTTHLSGTVRVAGLAAAGLLLLGAGIVIGRGRTTEKV